MKERVALSWSGGKDACLALHYLLERNINVEVLITTKELAERRTYGHGEKTDLLVKQSESLGIPIHFIETDMDQYTDRFIEEVKRMKEEYNLTAIAFGDIYFVPHREWGEKLAEKVGLKALYPLWSKKEEVYRLLSAFIANGYSAKVIRIRSDCLSSDWLGREINEKFYHDILLEKGCPMGENGEYHSFVFDGPFFSRPISVLSEGIVLWKGEEKLDLFI